MRIKLLSWYQLKHLSWKESLLYPWGLNLEAVKDFSGESSKDNYKEPLEAISGSSTKSDSRPITLLFLNPFKKINADFFYKTLGSVSSMEEFLFNVRFLLALLSRKEGFLGLFSILVSSISFYMSSSSLVKYLFFVVSFLFIASTFSNLDSSSFFSYKNFFRIVFSTSRYFSF